MQIAKHKSKLPIIAALLLSAPLMGAQAPTPKNGFTPNEKTAIQVARAVLQGMQGSLFVSSQQPFHAELQQSIWTVEGRYRKHPELSFGGGGLIMRIDKNTGAILGYYFARSEE